MSQVRFGIKPTIAVLAIAVTVFAYSTVEAQRQGRSGGFRRGGFQMDMVNLIANEQVQDELKITDEQREQIEKIVDAYRNDSMDLRSGLQDLSDEERNKKRAEIDEKQKQLTADAEKKVVPVLKEDQVKRLKEITIQQGPRSLLRQDVADALKLTDEQKTKIKAAIDAEDQQRRSLGGGFGGRGGKGKKADKGESADKGEGDKGEKGEKGERKGFGGGFEAFAKKQGELRKQTDDEIKKVLTEEQQKQLESLKGVKFELTTPQRRGKKGGEN